MTDLDLRDHLKRAMTDVAPPPGIGERALVQGHRLRTRRRAGRALGGLVAVASSTALAVAVLGGDTGTEGAGYATDVPAPPASPSPGPDTTGPPPGWWDTPAKRMLAQLKELLPEEVSVAHADLTADGVDGPIKAVGSLSGVLDTDTGPGAFQVLLYPPQPDPTVAPEQGGEPTFAQRIRCRTYMTNCTLLRDAAGAIVGRVSTDTEQGTTYYDVMVLGTGGGALYMYVGDSSGEKPGYEAPSASEPPLTTDELVAVIRDPLWTAYAPRS